MIVQAFDFRHRRVNPTRPVFRMRTRREVETFSPGGILGIGLHQTACIFGAKRGQTIEDRALGVRCHALALDGRYVLATPIEWIVNHANAPSRECLGLEVEGHYPGLTGGRIPGGKPATVWTASRRETAQEALRALVVMARVAGHPCRFLWAHRQSSGQRRADPGQEVWTDLSRFAVEELAMSLEPDRTWPSATAGRGRPIPRQWGGTARY